MKNLPDLTTSGQKFLAGGLILGALILLYFLLPPLIVIMTNLWLAVILGVPLLFLIFNYEVIWAWFKQISWNMTRKIISSNPLWHMYRYYDYLVEKIQGLEKSTREVMAVRTKTQRRVDDLIEENKKLEYQAEGKNKEEVYTKIIASKIATNQKNIDVLTPKLEFVNSQVTQLQEVYKLWVADSEILKHELDNKAAEYELLKELNGATDKASGFLGDNSAEMKMFKESLKQIESSVSQYTANIEAFGNNLQPKLTTLGMDHNYNVEKGFEIIEKMKAERLELKK